MATWNKFNCWITNVAAGLHANLLNASTDVLEAYLSNTAPDAAADTVKADLAEIATGNGYAGGVDCQNAAGQAAGVITVNCTDFTITASGGSVGPFQYVVFFNETATNDPLIGWYDNQTPLTLADGESLVVDFPANWLQVS